MDEILLEYLRRVVDKCCDPFDDVAMVRVEASFDSTNFIIHLGTPSGYTYGVGDFSFVIPRSIVADASCLRNDGNLLWSLIQSRVEACHNPKNCGVKYGSYMRRISQDPTDTLSNAVARINETFGAFHVRKEAAMASKTIKKVIFNPPATVVLWEDGSKTVVKVNHEYELFDREKGLAMAIAKHFLGNDCGSYYDEFRKWVK